MQLVIDRVRKQYRGGVWGLRDYNLPLGPGVLGLLPTYLWDGVDWTAGIILRQMLGIGAALMLVALAVRHWQVHRS